MNMKALKTKKIIRGTILTVLFVLLLHFTARYLGYVFFPRVNTFNEVNEGERWSEDYGQYYFARTERDTVDTVFIGSSHQYCSIDPNLLNKEYGQNCILLTSSSMGVKTAYYAVMEAIELQHPNTIVFESSSTLFGGSINGELEKYYFLDELPNWTRTKWLATHAYDDPIYLYYYPMTAMHTYVFDVTADSFRLPERLEKGERYRYYYDKITAITPPELISEDVPGRIPEVEEQYFYQIIDLCRKNHIQLILYIAPYQAGEGEQLVFNAVKAIAEENGLFFINTLHHVDDIGLDYQTDFMNGQHLNCYGQEKFTRYFGELLQKITA